MHIYNILESKVVNFIPWTAASLTISANILPSIDFENVTIKDIAINI